jgi:3-hydroxyacyl-[acyl-carrier-protein] dehydratase
MISGGPFLAARLTECREITSHIRMSNEEIERRIPHRKPMLLVDEIVSRDDTNIVCKKTFHPDEFFVQGHFPDQPIVPGVIQCECCLQAGAILLSANADSASEGSASEGSGGMVPVATRMDSVKFKRMVRPGDTVEIQVTLNDQVSNAYFMTGKMMLNGKLAARLDFACSIANPTPPASGASA